MPAFGGQLARSKTFSPLPSSEPMAGVPLASLEGMLSDIVQTSAGGPRAEGRDDNATTTSTSTTSMTSAVRSGEGSDRCGGCNGPLLAATLVGLGSDMSGMNFCMWCRRLQRLLATSPSGQRFRVGSADWVAMQNALQVLVLEGETDITCNTLFMAMVRSNAASDPSIGQTDAGSVASSSDAPPLVQGAPTPQDAAPSGSSLSPLQYLGARLYDTICVPQQRGFKRSSSGAALDLASPTAEHRMASGPSARSSAATSLAEPDDDETWQDACALTAESLDGALPDGFVNIRRMRATINSYASRMADMHWVTGIQMQSLTSLEKRFAKYSPTIVGQAPTANVELGYKQLAKRVHAMVELMKVVREWQGSKRDATLVMILKPLQVLEAYLAVARLTMAPDLRILKMYAEFFSAFARHARLKKALDVIDTRDLSSCVEEWRAAQSEVETTPRPDAAMDEDDGEEGESVGTGRKTPKKKADRTPCRLALGDDPSAHVQKLVAEALKLMVSTFPADINSLHLDLKTICTDLAATHQGYLGMRFTDAGQTDMFADALQSIVILFQTCNASDADKPATALVRDARRTIFALTKCDDRSADLARAILTYDCGKLVMRLSKDYSAAGIQDDAADRHFSNITASFEHQFDAAFENVEAWMREGDSVGETTTKGMLDKLEPLNGMVTLLTTTIRQWSTRGLESHMENCLILISNMSLLLGAALHVMVQLAAAKFKTAAGQGIDGPALAGQSCAIEEPCADDAAGGVATGDTEKTISAQSAINFPTLASFESSDDHATKAVQAAKELLQEAALWAAKASGMLTPLVASVNYMEGRFGECVKATFTDADSPMTYLQEAGENSGAIMQICNYIISCGEVCTAPKADLCSPTSSGGASNAYSDAVVTFASRHRSIQAQATQIKCHSPDFIDLKEPAMLRDNFLAFVSEVGAKLYGQHALAFIQAFFGPITSGAFGRGTGVSEPLLLERGVG